MLRTLIFSFLLLFFLDCFCQEKEFKNFIEELETYKLSSEIILYEDTIINLDNYELKWLKITGTYGGSVYCCGGKVFKGGTKEHSLLQDSVTIKDYIFSNEIYMQGKHFGYIYRKVQMIGDKYIVENFTFHEPRPTSAIHYVYETKYYEKKE